jgi:hypothetical protein
MSMHFTLRNFRYTHNAQTPRVELCGMRQLQAGKKRKLACRVRKFSRPFLLFVIAQNQYHKTFSRKLKWPCSASYNYTNKSAP